MVIIFINLYKDKLFGQKNCQVHNVINYKSPCKEVQSLCQRALKLFGTKLFLEFFVRSLCPSTT